MSAALLLSDERLTKRAIGGDPRAFAAIFDRYQERLYGFCLSLLGDRHDAQDALQNTMVKVLLALPGEERPIELKPWLYRIAHNESVELLRRRRPTAELDPDQAGVGEGLAAEAAWRQRLALLLADLGQLPERQRGALVMRELGGLGFDQIGAALGTSAAAARQVVYEARLGLRAMDAGREMGCAEAMRAISDGDRRSLRRREVRAHLRDCPACRAFHAEIEGRERVLAALAPLPAVALAATVQGVLGGGTGTATAVGGGAAGAAAGSGLFKGAATLAVVAAVGITAADRGALLPSRGDGNRGPEVARLAKEAPAAVETAVSPGFGTAGDEGEGDAVAGAPRQAALAGAEDTSVSLESAAGAGPEPNAPGPGRGSPASELKHSGPSPQGHEPAPAHEPPGEGGDTAETGVTGLSEGSEGGGEEEAIAAEGEGNGEGGDSQGKGEGHPDHPEHPAHPEHGGEDE